MVIEIPADQLTGNAKITVTTNADAKFSIANPAPTASASGTVTGTNGSPLSGAEITITLQNGTFTGGLSEGSDVSTWITNLSDAGSALTAQIKTGSGYSDGGNSVTIEINGTPDQTTSSAISISIPQANVSGATGNVTADGATFSIS